MFMYAYKYAIMKTTCRSGCHYNGLVVTHALGHIMYGHGDNLEGTSFS